MLPFNAKQDHPKVDGFVFDQFLKNTLKDSVPVIGVNQLAELRDAAIFDSRSQSEYSISRIPNAVRIGYDDFDPASVESFDRETVIVVYCSVGIRSEKIVEQLQTMGFRNVYNLYGGIFEWANQQKPVHDAEGHLTRRVHAYNRFWGMFLNGGEKVYTSDIK